MGSRRRAGSCLATAALLILPGTSASAQQGTITGRVTNATTLAPVPQARISVVGRSEAQAVSESDGSFELRLDAGVYDLVVEAGDFAAARFSRIGVFAGQATATNLPLESQGYRLAGFIVTASRVTASRDAIDTEITAPSSSHSISGQEITDRPVVSPVEHLRDLAAVDIMTQGIDASNVVVRGFDNLFSGALHMLTDNRLAGLPSLRANLMHFLPLHDEDIERAEIVLGPGSALYGPNTANGVLHLITKSPLDSPGTTVSLGVGERSVFQGAFRSAFLVNEDFGIKVSGQFFRGEEWPYVDPVEQSAAEDAEGDPAACIADRELRGLSEEEATTACGRIGERDPWISRYGVEARADWRFSSRGAFIATYGRTDASGIEMTGLSAVQTDHWVHQFVQGRLNYDRWFVQAYYNANDAGEAYLLRDGLELVDRSTLGVVQVQNGFSVADGRADFTYGWDYFLTQPDSRGTIYGDYEDEDEVREWGVYLQAKTALSSKVDLIAAGRIDSHSILPDNVFSPRVALVLKPDESNAIRFGYNRAFSTPTALNYFLDIGSGFAPDSLLASLGYTSRAFGSGRKGFAWRNADGSLKGMRSPFNPGGAGQLLGTVNGETLWGLALDGAEQQKLPIPQDVLDILQDLDSTPSEVAAVYLGGGRIPSTLQPDVPPIEESTDETFEVGWTGVWENRVRVSADLYHMKRKNFVSPLVVETPLLSLDPAGLREWLESDYVPVRTQDLVENDGLSLAEATAQATTEAIAVAEGVSQIPLAVVSSDVPQMENGGADLIATYRNVGELSLWGADVAVEWSVTPLWTLGASYSHVSDDEFVLEDSSSLALNAPKDKATLSLAFRHQTTGLNASARLRYTGPFPVNATDFQGHVDAYALVDFALGYRVPRTAATVQLALSNALNTGYRSFEGVPTVGRLALLRVKYDLF